MQEYLRPGSPSERSPVDRRRELPAWASTLVVWVPGALAVLGMVSFGTYNIAPATELLELTFLLCVFAAAPWSRARPPILLLVLVTLLAVRFTAVIAEAQDPLWDALQAHKWLLYLVALTLIQGRKVSRTQPLALSVKIITVAAAVKYSVGFAAGGFGARPGVLTENNYELAMMAGLFAVVFPALGARRYAFLLLFGAVTLLSGSRSGSIALVVVVLYVVVTSPPRHPFLRYLLVLAALAATVVPLLIFQSRAQAVNSIDRLNFLEVFERETTDWTVWQWLFGTPPITELSTGSCGTLSYYVLLFADDGRCYSVILHAFVLRVVFDFGVVGLVLAFSALLILLTSAGVARSLRVTLVAIAFTNALSVSGPNNIYVIWPIAVAILFAGNAPPDHDLRHPPDTVEMRPVRVQEGK
jgi:hypothetical protein